MPTAKSASSMPVPTPPAPSSGPLPPKALTLDWERFQEEVGHSFPNIAPFLEMGRLVAIEGSAVTIGFAKQATVARAMLEKPDNIQALTSLCERLSGQPVKVRIVELTDTDPPGPTMAQVRAAKEQEQKLVLFERAKAHPVVKQALEIFGAELADVRTVSSPHEVQE
jgi:DNA polymerase-3 subunit gamma/tau